MAYIIDARGSGGDVLVLGRTFTLPKSDATVVVGTEPAYGSLRFNPAHNRIEAYMPAGNNDWAWEAVGVDRGTSRVMLTTGAVMTGDLVMRSGTIYVDNGIPGAPSIAFDSKRSTGFSIDQTGNIRTTIAGAILTLVETTRFTVFGELVASTLTVTDIRANDAVFRDITARSVTAGIGAFTTGTITTLTGTSATLTTLTTQSATTETLSANTGSIRSLSANEVVIERPAGNSTPYVSEAVFDVNDREWILSHVGNHEFRFTYDGVEMMALTPSGTVRVKAIEDASRPVETFLADLDYPTGTVLVVGGTAEVTTTTTVSANAVAGIIRVGSPTRYVQLYEGRRALCRVQGPVTQGDTLVTGSVAGYAQTLVGPLSDPTAIVGIALANFAGTQGTIEVRI